MTTKVEFTKTVATGLFSAAGWKDAEAWTLEKLAAKLKDVPECVDDDHTFTGENAEAFSTALADLKAALAEAGEDGVISFEVTDDPAPSETQEAGGDKSGDNAEGGAPAAKKAKSKKTGTWQSCTIALMKEKGLSTPIDDDLCLELCTAKGADSGKMETARGWLKYVQDIVTEWNGDS